MLLTQGWKVASLLLVAGATVSGVTISAQDAGKGEKPDGPAVAPKTAPAESSVYTAKRGEFASSTINEKGVLDASESATVFNKVAGTSTIISILPEGSRVGKGDLVCELDSSKLKDELVNQEIATKSAEAAYQNAKLTCEVAEVAVVQYVEGIYVQERQTVLGEVEAAQSGIKAAEEGLERARLARKRLDDLLGGGQPKTASEILADLAIADRLAETDLLIPAHKMTLEVAQTKRSILERYTRPRTEKKLKSEVVKSRSDELAKEQNWELEKVKEAKMRHQIEYCKLYAPREGILLYGNDPTRFGRPVIEEGASVRERQLIFRIPELNAPMQVTIKVPEAVVARISTGDQARISVDAFPNEHFTGKVVKIQPLPDLIRPGDPLEKFYSTRIRFDKALTGFRPGLSGQAMIELTSVEIPITAIVRYHPNSHVAVKKPDGSFEWRDVVVGDVKGDLIEVRQGLQPGEQVSTNPIGLMSDDEKREKKPAPYTPPTPLKGVSKKAGAKRP